MAYGLKACSCHPLSNGCRVTYAMSRKRHHCCLPYMWQSLNSANRKNASKWQHFQNGRQCQSETCFRMAHVSERHATCIPIILHIITSYTARLLWPRCGTLLHSYCTGTYTEVTVLLLWGNSAVTMEYPHSYSVGVPARVLQGSTGATSKKQHYYFSVGTSSVTV